MKNWQRLTSPLALIIVAVVVIVGLVGYSTWSATQRKNHIAAAYENVKVPDYARLTLKKFEDVNKSAKSKDTVSAWVYRYTVLKGGDGMATDQVRSDLAGDLQRAGFTIDKNPMANPQAEQIQIYAHKQNVSLQANMDKPDITTGVIVITYEK